MLELHQYATSITVQFRIKAPFTCSHLPRVTACRQIIALEGGRIRHQGTLQEIQAAEPELVGRWQELIRLDRQQETREAAAETRTARERWRLLQVIQKFRTAAVSGELDA